MFSNKVLLHWQLLQDVGELRLDEDSVPAEHEPSLAVGPSAHLYELPHLGGELHLGEPLEVPHDQRAVEVHRGRGEERVCREAVVVEVRHPRDWGGGRDEEVSRVAKGIGAGLEVHVTARAHPAGPLRVPRLEHEQVRRLVEAERPVNKV